MDLGRRACCLVAVMMLWGCAAGGDSPWSSLLEDGRPSDLALADLAKGDFASAERHALAAVEREPGNPYAVLAAAMVYENSGRPELARRYYEILASQQPPAVATVGTGPQPARPVGDIALSAYRRLSPAAAPPSPEPDRTPATPPADPVAERFRILQRLLSEKLIAEPEYRDRRAANLGALLPYTAPPPPARLQRPPPPPDQFVQRLQSLAKNFEMRAIGAGEYAAERTAVLDGLLPATGAAGGQPPPPRDELARAAAIGRLERWHAEGLISADEQAKERRAMDAAWAPAPPVTAAPLPAAAPPPAGPASTAPRRLTPAKKGAGSSAVHLASLAGEKEAWAEWASLQSRFPQLKGLSGAVARVDLGKGKGVVYRLTAGPLADAAALEKLCRDIRDRRQYCAPAP